MYNWPKVFILNWKLVQTHFHFKLWGNVVKGEIKDEILRAHR